jgi:hypothetical protein
MQRGYLVAERLATTGRHDQKDILARYDPLNNLLLGRTELVETEDGF